MILNDVTNSAGLVIERAPAADVERLGHRDLDAGDVVAPPDGLQERVCESEVEQILDSLLAQEVIDPEDRRLGKHAMDGGVQGAGAGQVAAKRLLDDDPRPTRTSRLIEVVNYRREERRRDRQVVEWMGCLTELAPQCVKGFEVIVRPLHVPELGV